MSHKIFQELLQSNETTATALVTMLIDEFGTECLSWAPRTILLEVQEVFHAVPIQGNIDRMMAGIHLLTSNSFYTSLPDFNDLCVVLAGGHIQPGVFIPADTADCAWGITEASILAPPDDDDEGFSEDIKAFVGAVVNSEGIMIPPDILRMAHFDKDIVQRVRDDYSDDEPMFSGNGFVKARLSAIISQLMSMPLKTGNVEAIALKLMYALPQPTEDSPLPDEAI
jgi:hypothetical protein